MKQEEPTITYKELGNFPLILGRILAHCEFLHSAVSSSIATRLSQASPNLLSKPFPQRCKGRPKTLTHTSRTSLASMRQPIDGFHHFSRRLFPLNHFTPEWNTLLASTTSSNLNRIRDPPNNAKWSFPFNFQLNYAQFLRETRLGGWSKSPPISLKIHVQDFLVFVDHLLFYFNPQSVTLFRRTRDLHLCYRVLIPIITPLRTNPFEEVALGSSTLLRVIETPRLLSLLDRIFHPLQIPFLQETPRKTYFLPLPKQNKVETALLLLLLKSSKWCLPHSTQDFLKGSPSLRAQQVSAPSTSKAKPLPH